MNTDDACTLLASGRHEDALGLCRAMLAEDPEDRLALALAGRAFRAGGRYAEAIAMLSAIVDPDPDTIAELVRALGDAGLIEEAAFRASHPGAAPSRLPANTEAVENLRRGNEHLLADRIEDAAAAYHDALAIDPDYPDALGNLGNVLTALGDLPGAHASYEAALRSDPNNAGIGFAYGLSLLLDGRFQEGWRRCEARRREAGLRWNFDRHVGLPQWRDGMDLAGRHVLVMAEQGHGDMIQFARLVPILARHAGRVVLELPRALHRVFGDLPGVTRMIDRDAPAPDCDIACPLLSLPSVLDLMIDGIPPPVAFAREDLVAQWAAWLGEPDGRKRVGLVVSGEPRHPHDAQRSIPLALFRPVLDTGHHFIVVQTELREADRDTRDTMEGLRFPGAALTDFGDTAGLLANLDLLITVDTAAAHLAGSLGIPTWLLLAHAPDHRWLVGREDSPWYPSMRLFRQPSRGDWPSVLRRVADLLR